MSTPTTTGNNNKTVIGSILAGLGCSVLFCIAGFIFANSVVANMACGDVLDYPSGVEYYNCLSPVMSKVSVILTIITGLIFLVVARRRFKRLSAQA